MKKLWMASVVCVALVIGLAATAQADSYYWYPQGNGSFLNGDDWVDDSENTGTVPGVDDYAYISRPNSSYEDDYTITLSDDHEVFRLLANTGADSTITVDLGGNTLTVGQDSIYGFRVEADGADERVALFKNGTVSAHDLGLGVSSGISGWATLKVGDGATLNMPRDDSDGTIQAGYNSPGRIYVEDGGKVFMAAPSALTQSVIGNGSDGALYVNGTGEFEMDRTTTNNYLTFGYDASNATLSITNGGTVKGAYVTRFGWLNGADVDVLIDGSRSDGEGGTIASSYTTDRLDIGRESQASTAYVTVSNGGKLSVTRAADDVDVEDGSTLEIDGGTVEFAGGGDFFEDSTYKLTLHDTGDTPLDAGGTTTLATTGNGVTFTLSLADGLKPVVDDVFTVLDYSDGTLTGEFAGLADGDTIVDSQTGAEFEIYYDGYGGSYDNQIVLLTTIPEPHSLGMILLGLVSVGLRRRLHRA